MSEYLLSSLYRQRTSVVTGIGNTKDNISNLEGKIERLDRAFTTLGNKINELIVVKRNIGECNVNINMWKGNESERFEREYQIYIAKTERYFTKTIEAREVIDEEKRRLESSLDNAEIHLSRLTNSLNALNYQISQT